MADASARNVKSVLGSAADGQEVFDRINGLLGNKGGSMCVKSIVDVEHQGGDLFLLRIDDQCRGITTTRVEAATLLDFNNFVRHLEDTGVEFVDPGGRYHAVDRESLRASWNGVAQQVREFMAILDKKRAISKQYDIPVEAVNIGPRGQFSPPDASGLLWVRTLEEDQEYYKQTRFEHQRGSTPTVTLDDGKVFVIRGEHVEK